MEMEQNKDIFFMKQAIIEAQKAFEKGEIPIGAVIVCKDRVIARGYNLCESLCDPTAHAEMQVITAACSSLGGKYLTECTLYVTVEPCPMCAAACYWAQVGRIVYGADDEKRGFSTISNNLIHPKTKIEKGVLKEICTDIIISFFKKLRKN